MPIPQRSAEALPQVPRRQDLAFGHSSTSMLLPPNPAHVDAIVESHARCAALGLSRIQRPEHQPLLCPDLEAVRRHNHRLLQHAAPVMELLLEQILATQSIVVLADTQGTLLHSIGETCFLERALRVALEPGANWAESSRGTNGIGTTLVAEQPTVVHADEHYLHALDFLTCTAAPLFDPRGNLLGVLNVSSDHRSYHMHTMGLLKMSARMVENHCLTDDYRQELRLHFHLRPEFIGTLNEGIVAIGREGRFLGANRSALDQLGMSNAALRMSSVVSVFGTTVGAIIDHFRTSMPSPMVLRLQNGEELHVQARFNWPTWHQLGSVVSRTLAADWNVPVWESPRVPPRERMTVEGSLQKEPSAWPSPSPSSSRPVPVPVPRGQALNGLQTGDAQMDAVVAKVRRVLDRDIPVMILGETGTGKEMLARATHEDSLRAAKPFVAVNCAAIPEALIEAELFGYEEGAFTGARRKGAVGKIVQADGGTLFLDEIGDMPLPLQARLLRVLQERQVTPLGSTRATSVDIALISATHCNLREMIARGRFREDLYYRINGLVVKLPPLRERSDLLTLAQKILRRHCTGAIPNLAPEVLRLLRHHAWPGNIRQLANVLRTAAVMAESEALITRDHLSADFLEDVEGPAPPSLAPLPPPAPPQPQQEGAAAQTLQQVEWNTILKTLEACGGNISEASKRLGISRTTIYRRRRRQGGADEAA